MSLENFFICNFGKIKESLENPLIFSFPLISKYPLSYFKSIERSEILREG